MADIFDIVADPTRRDLMHLLLERYVSKDSESGEISVGEMVDALGLSQPTVSKHLKVLRDHGLVGVREEGQHRYYSLDAAPLEELEDWLIPFLSADFDPSVAEAVDAADSLADSAVYTAWAGAEVGDRVGRAVADSSHRAQVAIHDAREQVAKQVRRFTKR
jgi:DNA-binding transcriptional ArsR family regulator